MYLSSRQLKEINDYQRVFGFGILSMDNVSTMVEDLLDRDNINNVECAGIRIVKHGKCIDIVPIKSWRLSGKSWNIR